MVEKGKTISELAKYLEINESTLYRKINGVSEFNWNEIQKICYFLDLDSPIDIFFTINLT